MKAIIFAGGIGTRLWPLSRKNSPKQFEKVIGDKSTIQLSVDRLRPDFQWEDIYIATGERYVDIIHKQIPQIPKDNIIGEPQMKDVGPAVGLTIANLIKRYPHTPIAILWCDHLVKNEELFRKTLITAEKIVTKGTNHLVFITQKPRFASQNLGWIEYSGSQIKINGMRLHKYEGITYRPSLQIAEKFFKSGHHAWNLGYFVTTPYFLWKQYKRYQPQLYRGLSDIEKSVSTAEYKKILKDIYPTFPKISFDDAILSRMDKKDALVISENLKWSDIGAWEALKEALQSSPEDNVIHGKVLVNSCQDSLIYNYTDQLVVTLDLSDIVVVNTHDVTLICHKNSVPKIKKLVESLSGSENEHLT